MAENEHLRRTAEQLYISPPALSASIARLERELGTTLFNRGKGMKLNERGMVFLRHINQLLGILENAKREIEDISGVSQMQLSVGVASSIVWKDLFLSFIKENPSVCLTHSLIDLRNFSSEDLLSRYEYVIAAPGDIPTDNLHFAELYNDDWPMLAVPPSHRFAKSKSVSLLDAKDERFIAISKEYSARKLFDEMFSIAGFKPNIVAECDYLMRGHMVLEGHGITLVTAHTRKANMVPGACFIKISDPVYRRSQILYWHARHYQTKASILFREYSLNYYKDGFAPE